MSFKTNLLFIFVIFSMFSVVHLCSSSPSILPSISPPKDCHRLYDSGPCFTEEMKINKSYERRYWYDSLTKECNIFPYGGCGGNGNNYEDYEKCLIACDKEHQAILSRLGFPG